MAWITFAKTLLKAGLKTSIARSAGKPMLVIRSQDEARALYLLGSPHDYRLETEILTSPVPEVPEMWGRRRFLVENIVQNFLGQDVVRFAPPTVKDSPHYSGFNYPQMYARKYTDFDFTLVCEEGGALREKMLFEYKSGKSSKKIALDGNAHERLSFQALQYLEIAAASPNVSFNVIASAAFSRYRNKYHVEFNQQAVRLGDAFRCFVMRFMACCSDYERFFRMLAGFVLLGRPLHRDYRDVRIR